MEVTTKQKSKTLGTEKSAKMEPPSLRCVLCDAIIYFRNGSQERFEKHMRNEHEVATKEMDFLLAMHFTHQEERNIWKKAMEDRIRRWKEAATRPEETLDETIVDVEKEEADKDTEENILDESLDKLINDKDDQQNDNLLDEDDPDAGDLIIDEAENAERDEKEIDAMLKKEEKETEALLERERKRNELDKLFKIDEDKSEDIVAKDDETMNNSIPKKKQEKPRRKQEKSCPLCYFVPKQASNLKRHMMLKHKEEEQWIDATITTEDLRFNCTICNLAFVSKNLLTQHQTKNHAGSGTSQEKEELQEIQDLLMEDGGEEEEEKVEEQKSNESLIEDVKQENKKDEFPCSICPLSYAMKQSLVRHMKKNHTKDVSKVEQDAKEDEPLMTEKNETSIVEEEGNMAEPNEEDVSESDDRTQKQCPECPKKFKWSPNREGRMAFHMKREHKESAPRPSSKFAKCKFCYREYRGGAAKKNLRIHQANVHQEDLHLLPALEMDLKESGLDLDFTCPFCKLAFITSNVLNYHVSFEHKDNQLKAESQEPNNTEEETSVEEDLPSEETEDEDDMDISVLENKCANLEKELAGNDIILEDYLEMDMSTEETEDEDTSAQGEGELDTNNDKSDKENSAEPSNNPGSELICCNRPFATIKQFKKHEHNVHKRKEKKEKIENILSQ